MVGMADVEVYYFMARIVGGEIMMVGVADIETYHGRMVGKIIMTAGVADDAEAYYGDWSRWRVLDGGQRHCVCCGDVCRVTLRSRFPLDLALVEIDYC